MIRKKTLGTVLIVAPLLILPVSWAMYIFSAMAIAGKMEAGFVVAMLILVTFFSTGIIMVMSVVGIIVGVPLGIYFLLKKQVDTVSVLKEKEQYQKLASEQIDYISRWSWGAFLNPLVWALGNRMWYAAIGCLLPIYNIFVWLRVAMEGRALSWENSDWNSFRTFQKRQKIVFWIALGIILLLIVLYIIGVLTHFDLTKNY